MIETRLLARLLATARTVTALGAVPATREVGAEQSELVRAQVTARLADGTFRVLVDGRSVKLALPADVKPGDVVELRVVNRGLGTPADGSGAAYAVVIGDDEVAREAVSLKPLRGGGEQVTVAAADAITRSIPSQ